MTDPSRVLQRGGIDIPSHMGILKGFSAVNPFVKELLKNPKIARICLTFSDYHVRVFLALGGREC